MKPATIWRPTNGEGTSESTNEGDSLLLETGDNILQENGDDLLLNESVVTPKAATEWNE